MSHGNLTQWIEDADARQVLATAMAERGRSVMERHCLHLGVAIVQAPFRPSPGASRELLSIGGHVWDRVRHPLGGKPGKL